MRGVSNLFPKDESLGCASIKKFEISASEAKFYNLRVAFREDPIMMVTPGSFVKLYVNNELMMSDTLMEKTTNRDFIYHAKGDVMIAGLGIGLILENLRAKIESKEVTSITIYEKFQDVIDLVAPKYSDLPVTYHCKDILTYSPPKEEKYDTIYFDIWPSIDYSYNLPQIRTLHNRWKFHKKTSDSYMNSWMKEFLQAQKRRDV